MNEQDKPESGSSANPSPDQASLTDEGKGGKGEPSAAASQAGPSTDLPEENPDLVTGELTEEEKPGSGKKAAPKKTKSPTGRAKKSTADKKSSAEKKPNGKNGRISLIVTLLIAVIFAAIFGYGFHHNHQHWRTAKQNDEAQAMNYDTLSTEMDELRQTIKTTQGQNTQLLAQLQDSAREREAIQQTLDTLSAKLAEKGRGPLRWRLAEVEYLLNIANHRLILERDVDTAIQALGDADRRLEAMSDPALIPVRQKIASEITALKSVDLPPIASMAVKLGGLADNIERLPLVNKERIFDHKDTEDGPVDDWRELPKAMWQDIKSLVTIRRNQEPVERLLPPDEIHYLYQNLGLKLEEARIALLQQNTPIFRQHLQDIKSWVQRYFDPDTAAVSTLVATLSEMETTELKPALPDISGSLRALREWTATHKADAGRIEQDDQEQVGSLVNTGMSSATATGPALSVLLDAQTPIKGAGIP